MAGAYGYGASPGLAAARTQATATRSPFARYSWKEDANAMARTHERNARTAMESGDPAAAAQYAQDWGSVAQVKDWKKHNALHKYKSPLSQITAPNMLKAMGVLWGLPLIGAGLAGAGPLSGVLGGGATGAGAASGAPLGLSDPLLTDAAIGAGVPEGATVGAVAGGGAAGVGGAAGGSGATSLGQIGMGTTGLSNPALESGPLSSIGMGGSGVGSMSPLGAGAPTSGGGFLSTAGRFLGSAKGKAAMQAAGLLAGAIGGGGGLKSAKDKKVVPYDFGPYIAPNGYTPANLGLTNSAQWQSAPNSGYSPMQQPGPVTTATPTMVAGAGGGQIDNATLLELLRRGMFGSNLGMPQFNSLTSGVRG